MLRRQCLVMLAAAIAFGGAQAPANTANTASRTIIAMESLFFIVVSFRSDRGNSRSPGNETCSSAQGS